MALFGNLFRRDPEKSRLERRKRELTELREVIRSEEIKLNLALRDLEELKRIEDELLEKGKGETSDITKRTVAYKIKDLRDKQKALESRISIYNNRITVLREQINSLETLVEAGSSGLPNESQIEQASMEASQKLEQLNTLLQKVEGAKATEVPSGQREDGDINGIMKEFDSRADRELKRAELESFKREKRKEAAPDAPARPNKADREDEDE
jgi:uncharacterized phage infection (PIP) family protein YhgE